MRFVLIVAVLLVVMSGSQAQPTITELDLEDFWEQVRAQPDDFSVACMPLENRSNMVLLNTEERFPLASVTKLLIFIEYARRLDAGEISRFEMVDLETLDRYDLPRTNRGAHRDFLALYPRDTQALTLWEVASIGMLQYSSNAASDFLLDYLAPVDWEALYRSLGMTNTDYPHPLSRIPLLMNNHETGEATWRDVETLSVELAESYFERYVNDADWREAEIAYRAERWRAFPPWDIQADILQEYTATGTASDLLRLLYAIYGESGVFTEGTQDLVREGLRWSGYAAIYNTYAEYGSKLGFYSGGVLALVAYGDPFNGTPVISVTLMRDIPRRVYNAFLEDDSIGKLAHWMNLNACDGLLDEIA